jgi:hypothetical protein
MILRFAVCDFGNRFSGNARAARVSAIKLPVRESAPKLATPSAICILHHMRSIGDRFSDLLGSWVGRIDLRDGDSGLAQMDFTPVFNGAAIETHVLVTDLDGQSILNRGVGFWSMPGGRVRCAAYGDWVGFAILDEVADDPDALVLSGPLGDGRAMTVAFVLEDGELLHSSSVTEGYEGLPRPRTVARLRRRAAMQPGLR